MPNRQPSRGDRLPDVWLVSDARNDARLEAALARLPRGSGLIFRHYHLDRDARRVRFDRLKRIAHRFGHRVILAGTVAEARRWRADGAYGDAATLAAGTAGLRLATAHGLRGIAAAKRMRAAAILLSPVFQTRSHPGGKCLGRIRFRLLAARAQAPAIALGGMDQRRARALAWKKWAAIDGI